MEDCFFCSGWEFQVEEDQGATAVVCFFGPAPAAQTTSIAVLRAYGVLCCAVMCSCDVLRCAVLHCAVRCGAVLCCAVLCSPLVSVVEPDNEMRCPRSTPRRSCRRPWVCPGRDARMLAIAPVFYVYFILLVAAAYVGRRETSSRRKPHMYMAAVLYAAARHAFRHLFGVQTNKG